MIRRAVMIDRIVLQARLIQTVKTSEVSPLAQEHAIAEAARELVQLHTTQAAAG